MLGNWHQLWEVASSPDNVPIVGLLFLIPFYMWYAFRQALANDRLIDKLAADPASAKAAHRKTQPWNPKWDREVHTWPYLMRVEFVAAILVTVLLMVWSLTLNAPLEEPANPNVTMNPAKAPWYFLGLQEMLVYFDPWMAGVVMPTLIIVGLMAVPYIDANPLGQRLLHLQAAQARYLDVLYRIFRLMGGHDRYRHLHKRPWLDVVLADRHLGRRAGGIRGQPEHGSNLRRERRLAGACDAGREPVLRADFGANDIRDFSDYFLFHYRGIRGLSCDECDGICTPDFPPYDAAANRYDESFSGADVQPAREDFASAGFPGEIYLGNSVVQHLVAIHSTLNNISKEDRGA